ncbi:uncharacterized protein LOC143669970 [Tamandua tetradactyla]|uniref:uncharacterized protein LOC143669970 n=1 Tax=Tamandua tetradactyla TaxID=48850 RepID=UPI00405445CB
MHKASCGPDKGTVYEIAHEWLSLTAVALPASPLTPALPLLLDSSMDELEKLGALASSTDQAKPNILDTILEIKEEPSVLSLPPTSVPDESPFSLLPFPHPGVTSASAHSSEAAPLQNNIKPTQHKFSDVKKMRRGFSDSENAPEVLGDKFVASACTHVGSLYKTLPVIGEEDEEICEGVVSGIQTGLQESQEPDSLSGSHDATEVTASLHIEEEEEEKPDCLKSLTATPTDHRVSEEACSAVKTSNEPLSFSAEDKTSTPFPSGPLPSSPFPSPFVSVSALVPELSQPTQPYSPPLLPKYSHPQEINSPQLKADFKREIFVLGKPPRSPVLARRSCSSPVRALGGSHRVGSERPAPGPTSWPCPLSGAASSLVAREVK